MLQQFSKTEILNSGEFSNTLVCVIDMFLYKHSFVTIYLQVSIFAQMSENWAPGTDRQAGHPLDVHVSPVGAQVRVPLPLWASGCPRLPQACLCRWGCPANTQPHAAHCFNSNLIPASFSSFSSRTPPPNIQKRNPPHHQPWMPLVVDSASQNIWK